MFLHSYSKSHFIVPSIGDNILRRKLINWKTTLPRLSAPTLPPPSNPPKEATTHQSFLRYEKQVKGFQIIQTTVSQTFWKDKLFLFWSPICFTWLKLPRTYGKLEEHAETVKFIDLYAFTYIRMYVCMYICIHACIYFSALVYPFHDSLHSLLKQCDPV